jgi:RNA-directed DNA polymerase
VAARIPDRRVLRLIRSYLTAGVINNGLFEISREGTPQGGPLSPLLSNLVLDELDRELERRGHCFVRYADDCNIYVRSEKAGHRVMANLTRFIEGRLKLQVNAQKSAVARPWQRSFLGFTVTDEPQPRRRIADKAVTRFKDRVRDLTRRNRGVSLERMIADLNPLLRGWAGYFASANGASWAHWTAGHGDGCVVSSGSSGRRGADATRNSDASRSPRRWPVRPSSVQRDHGG